MIAVKHWHLLAEAHPGGKVVSAVITFAFLLAAIACVTQTACLSHDVCLLE